MSAFPITIGLRELEPGRLEVSTPCKVNLVLLVGGLRADGYHELDSLMVALDLQDELEVERRGEGGEVLMEIAGSAGTDVPADERNLCVRAARAYASATGFAPSVRVQLSKRVPAAGGLGGGSGNAAGMLLALEHWNPQPLGRAALVEVAVRVGADVPFFLWGGAARCRGKGEIVEPCPALPVCTGVLLVPSFGVSTALVYQELDRLRASGEAAVGLHEDEHHRWQDSVEWLGAGHTDPELPAGHTRLPALGVAGGTAPAALRVRLHNDLEAAALACSPRLAAVRAGLASLDRKPLLCGSGSSFLLLAGEHEVAGLAAHVHELGVGAVHTVRSYCLETTL